MLANSQTVSSLCVHNYVRTCCLLHSYLFIIRTVHVRRVRIRFNFVRLNFRVFCGSEAVHESLVMSLRL